MELLDQAWLNSHAGLSTEQCQGWWQASAFGTPQNAHLAQPCCAGMGVWGGLVGRMVNALKHMCGRCQASRMNV